MLNAILPKPLRIVDNLWFPTVSDKLTRFVKSRRYLRYACIPYNENNEGLNYYMKT